MSEIDMKAMRDMVMNLELGSYADELEVGACDLCCLVSNGGNKPTSSGGC